MTGNENKKAVAIHTRMCPWATIARHDNSKRRRTLGTRSRELGGLEC